MLETIFEHLTAVHAVFWGYIAFVLISLMGIYFTIRTRAFQLRAFPEVLRTFGEALMKNQKGERGVHPLKALFASVGGMIGIGNIVGIVTAVQIAGPGALLWVWVAGFIGAMIKYSEIFLGFKYRVPNSHGGYDGGPMYFLKAAFKNRFIPTFIAILLCIYGVEIYQFSVITESVVANFSLNKYLVIGALLFFVLYASIGGVSRIGKICSWIMPFFVVTYVCMGLWVVGAHLDLLPALLKEVVISAFTGHAAVGGFVGGSVLLAIQYGISQAAYSGDIGIGYDSIIQSESRVIHPEKQARLAILGISIDNLVCTISILLVLLSGLWKSEVPVASSQLVQTALSAHFPYMHIFIPLFLVIAGYSTLIAYFCVGLKCARFLSPRYGFKAYILFGACFLILFSFFDSTKAQIIMSLSGALLLITNLLGIYKLRNEIEFHLPHEKRPLRS